MLFKSQLYYMFFAVICLVSFLMFLFPNTLFYTISLLILSVFILIEIVRAGFLRTLIILLILIIYAGAMLILISYICAVSPNFVVTFRSEYFLVCSFSYFLNFIFYYFLISTNSTKSRNLIDYLFREWGAYTFFFIVFILFFTLLIVTSQYFSPQGPLRSLEL